MKIALVSQEYPPETARGGIGSQTYMKAQGLADLGHEVFVISRSMDTKRYESMDGNIRVIRIPGMEDRLPDMTDAVQWITHSVQVAAEIEALHQRIGLDIIDFPEWAAEGYVYLLNRTAWHTVPVVIQLHGPLVMLAHTVGWPEPNSEFYRVGTHMEATCVQLAEGIYSSSECSASWIRSHYHPGDIPIPTIHLGVDTAKFAPQAVPKNDRPTIIFIGKVVPNKGVEELVEAACHLVPAIPDLRLRMIGPGQEELVKRLREKAEQLGAPDLLDLPGFIQKDALPEELSRAHVFAAPSWYEGGPGFVYLEAMACGLPVVGCSGSGVDEIVRMGENGLLVPPQDVKALAEALGKILRDQKLSESMGAKARAYVLKEADSKHCLKKLEAFYHATLKSRSQKIKSIAYD